MKTGEVPIKYWSGMSLLTVGYHCRGHLKVREAGRDIKEVGKD